MTNTVTYHLGDVRDVMAAMELGSVDLVVTSPPFWNLRSYLDNEHPLKAAELGAEPDPADYIDNLLALTADLVRVLPDWGSLCVEIGDTMSGSGGGGGDYLPGGMREGQQQFAGSAVSMRESNAAHWRQKNAARRDERHQHGGDDDWSRSRAAGKRDNTPEGHPLNKSMCIIPHAYSLALAYGRNPINGATAPCGQLRVRNVICWARPNPPVGSLGRRNVETRTGDSKFRPATSYITIACPGTARYFDLEAVRLDAHPENARPNSPLSPRMSMGSPTAGPRQVDRSVATGSPPLDWHTDDLDGDWLWRLTTSGYTGSHYATFPLTLPTRLIEAMCPADVCTVCGLPRERITASIELGERRVGDALSSNGIAGGDDGNPDKLRFITSLKPTVGWTDCGHDAYRPGVAFDPFGGSGTTAVAAAQVGRDSVLVDLDARNVDLCRRRLTESMLVLDERRVGDAFVWSVDPSLPGLKGEHPAQQSLFG